MLKYRMLPLVAAFAVATQAFAAPLPATKGEGDPIAKARAALANRVTIKAENKTVTEAIDIFKDIGKAEIQLDTGTIQMMGIDVNTPMMNIDVKDLPLKDALMKAFSAMNLRCGVTAQGIVVSTDEGITIRQLRQRVNLDADNKILTDVLKGLANETGANVVIDPRIAKKVSDEKITLKMEDVPLETAVRIAADVGGFSVVRMSNVLFVTSDARAEKLRPDADKPVPPTPGNPFFPGGFDGPGGVVPQAVPGGPVPAPAPPAPAEAN
jgi:hypothetical protein